MDQEKRKRSRVPIHIDVSVLLHGEVIQLQTQSLNVSLTGILCTSNPRFQKDDLCTVIITLNKEFQISIASKFLRVEQKETAISFISMDDESFVHLKRMLQYNIGDAERIDEELRHPAF